MPITTLLREYANWMIAECYGEDEAAEPVVLAALRTETECEARHLARALLARLDALTDAPYRVGGSCVDPRIAALALAARYE